MESILDNSTSLILFDHTIKDSLLDNSNDTSLFNEHTTATSEPTLTLTDCTTSNFTTYLFFLFPIIGFFVLVMGSCLLRKRQLRQDAEAIERYRERVNAADRERRLKEERRTRLVEKALVTTKVTFLPSSRSRIANSSRGRSATMETMESSSSSTVHGFEDMDSTVCSSCSRRASEISDGGNIITAEEREGELSNAVDAAADEAERGQRQYGTASIDGSTHKETATKYSEPNSNQKNSSPLPPPPPPPSSSLDVETCAICLEPYKENDNISYSKHQNCSHAFHTQCILLWLKDEYRNDCPCCRGPYLHLCVVEDDSGDYQLGGSGGGGVSTAERSAVANEDAANTAVTDIAQVMDPTSAAAIAASNNAATEAGDDSNV